MILCNRMQDILRRDSICITHDDDDLRICTDSLDMDRVLYANEGYHKARCNVLLSLQLYHAVLCHAMPFDVQHSLSTTASQLTCNDIHMMSNDDNSMLVGGTAEGCRTVFETARAKVKWPQSRACSSS